MTEIRKHVTVRYLPNMQLQYNEEEGAWGAVLPALPDTAVVRIHGVFPLGGHQLAQVSIVTEEVVSEEELAQLMAEAEETDPPAASPEPPSEASNVIELPKGTSKPKRKRSGPPPTAG